MSRRRLCGKLVYGYISTDLTGVGNYSLASVPHSPTELTKPNSRRVSGMVRLPFVQSRCTGLRIKIASSASEGGSARWSPRQRPGPPKGPLNRALMVANSGYVRYNSGFLDSREREIWAAYDLKPEPLSRGNRIWSLYPKNALEELEP